MAVQFSTDIKRIDAYLAYPEDIAIVPELNGRTDKPDIEWLITDILAHGQHTPVIIRKDGLIPTLVAGFSRWRAVSEINKRNLAQGMKIKLQCKLALCNEEEAFLLNISENRFRNPTTAIDDAHNIKRLLNIYGKTEEEVAGIYFPTAKTEGELKEAAKFVRDRIALLTLSPEAEEAIKSGRVKESAAKAIAKLSQAQQREVIKPDYVKPSKPAKPIRDVELLRRCTAVLEDVSGLLTAKDMDFIEVDRILLLNLHTYVEEARTAAK